MGVLIYGIAEASTAYLITKITDPPPDPLHSEGFAASQATWRSKQDFMQIPLANIDAHTPRVGEPSGHTSVMLDDWDGNRTSASIKDRRL